MKRIFFSLLLIAASATTFAQATWKSDKYHSQLKFEITHLLVSTVSGSFKDFDATVVASKEDFSDATFDVTANTASITTDIDQRDTHIKSADFLDVAKYPTLTFKSTSLKKVADKNYKLTGNLTLHGITKVVVLDVVYRGTGVNGYKKTIAGFKITGTIKRSDFGVGTTFGASTLSDEIDVIAQGEIIKQ